MKFTFVTAWLFFSLFNGCFGARSQNVEWHGVQFEKARVQDNGFVIGRIGADTFVAGRPCRKGWIHLHPNGALAGFFAAQDITLARFAIPAGTWVAQEDQGVVTACAFPRDVEVQGQLCRGGIGGAEGVRTAFHRDGALKAFYTRKSVLIDGIPCQSNLFKAGITLYANGRLQSAILAEDFVLEGRKYRKGDPLQLTPAGHPVDR
jgi:hypothetical protein